MAGNPQEEAREALKQFARDYSSRKDALDAEVRRLQDDRDAAIIEAFSNDVTTREIARILGEISHQRVAQIVLKR